MNPQFREPVFFVPDSKTVIDTAALRDGVFISTIESETLEQIRLRYPGAEVGEFDDVIAGKADSYKSEPIEITPAAFEEALCVLPPVGWKSARGAESFKMPERTYGVITAIYARVGERCFHLSDSILMSADTIAERIANSEAFKNPAKWVNASYCQNCVWQTHPEMLTTYCLRDARCDRCGEVSGIGLAMVKALVAPTAHPKVLHGQCPICKHYGDDCTGTPAEWSGSPDPSDPDNFWIDDATNERVNAKTGERTPCDGGVR